MYTLVAPSKGRSGNDVEEPKMFRKKIIVTNVVFNKCKCYFLLKAVIYSINNAASDLFKNIRMKGSYKCWGVSVLLMLLRTCCISL